MFLKIVLAVWSGIGLLWWVISWRLVVSVTKPERGAVDPKERKSLTIFKPLPLLNGSGLKIEARGLESFISQMDELTELLLGVHEVDWPEVSPFINQMQETYPEAKVVVVRRSEADTLFNPKIAWQKLLVPRAQGQLWLWSDADIVAPPGFLDQARAEFESCRAEMLTFPYVVRTMPHRAAFLDALFVNIEFYPGVLLLRQLGPVDFGLGAAMLFSRESFLRKTNWEDLGSSIADDFILGQALRPVRLGSITLETVPDTTDWRDALEHYFRWKKTVCWCQPVGFAAQVIAMPLFGWMALVMWHPANLSAWAGLLGMIQIDVLFAALICREIGCRLDLDSLLAMEAWSVWRILFWILCWLPGRVKWREKLWRFAREPARALSSRP